MSFTISYANRAKTQLAQQVLVTDTTIALQAGTGDLFPQAGNGSVFVLTLVSTSTPSQFEICYVTNRSADTLTVLRGMEGTHAQPFSAGDSASLNMSAGVFELFPQGGYMGVYSDAVAGRIGGYRRNAILADPTLAATFWVSLTDSNTSPPSPENGNWMKLDLLGREAMLSQAVSGTLGMGPNDAQGIWLHLNGNTGNANFGAGNGRNFDLASAAQVAQASTPVGTISAYAGEAPPYPWLLCNGQGFDAGSWPALFQLLGTNTTPDLRGVFLRGLDRGRGFDSDSQRNLLSLQGGTVIVQNHDVRSVWRDGNVDPKAAGCGVKPDFQGRGSDGDGSGWGVARPVNVGINYIIKGA